MDEWPRRHGFPRVDRTELSNSRATAPLAMLKILRNIRTVARCEGVRFCRAVFANERCAITGCQRNGPWRASRTKLGGRRCKNDRDDEDFDGPAELVWNLPREESRPYGAGRFSRARRSASMANFMTPAWAKKCTRSEVRALACGSEGSDCLPGEVGTASTM